MENKEEGVEHHMDRLERSMDRVEERLGGVEEVVRQLQETVLKFRDLMDPRDICTGSGNRNGACGAETEEEEKKREDAVAEEGKKEISNKVEEEIKERQEEEDQDILKIIEKKEHLHLDILDQIMEETQPVGQSHKLSNGSKTIFTIIAEEIREAELPQSAPDRRRPRIGCQSFISAGGDTIIDVNESNLLNAMENDGVVVLKIKSGFNILGGEREEEDEQVEGGGRGVEKIGKKEEEVKKIHEMVETVTAHKLNGVGFGNGLQTTWPNSKITESQNGLVGNRETRNVFSLINQIGPNNIAQGGLNQHTQTQWNERGGAEVFQLCLHSTGGTKATAKKQADLSDRGDNGVKRL